MQFYGGVQAALRPDARPSELGFYQRLKIHHSRDQSPCSRPGRIGAIIRRSCRPPKLKTRFWKRCGKARASHEKIAHAPPRARFVMKAFFPLLMLSFGSCLCLAETN